MRKLLAVVVVLVLSVSVLLACSTPSPTTTPAPAPSPTATPKPAPAPAPSPSPSPKPSPSPTASVAPVSFAGKTITFIVGSGAGGDSDMMTRLLGRYIGKFIPGNPAVITRNMSPGVVASNFVYRAKGDGLTLQFVSLTSINAALSQLKAVNYKLPDFHPLLAMPETGVIYASASVIKDPKDLVKPEVQKKLIFGSTAAISSTAYSVGKFVLGIEAGKEVWGYASSGDEARAFLSGETNMARVGGAGYDTLVKPYVQKGEVTVLWQSGVFDAKGNVVRESTKPEIPTIAELHQQIHGKPPSGPAWDVYLTFEVGSRYFGQTVVLPPNAPADVKKTMEQAFAALVKDPAFRAEVSKVQPLELIVYGEGLPAAWNAGVNPSAATVKWFRDTLSKNFGAVFD